MRAFTSSDVIQGKQNALVAVVDAGHGLDSPAEGNTCGVIFQMASTLMDPPEQWDLVTGAGSTDSAWQCGIFLRPDLPAGETEWEIRALGGGPTQWAWRAEEWRNVSRAPILATARRDAVTTGETTIPLGPSSPTLDTAELAALLVVVGIQGGVTGGSVFPATATYTGDFVETDVITVGDGTVDTDVQLRIARKLLTSPETGPWSTTIDFGAQPMTNKGTFACMIALRPERHVGDI